MTTVKTMNDTVYTEKEIDVFFAILELIKNGADFRSITVSEIASAAGIGKGTVYEYFSSKNDMVAKAIVYILSNELKQYLNSSLSADSFEDKIGAVIRTVADNRDNKCSLLSLLISNLAFDNFKNAINEKNVLYLDDMTNSIINDIFESGIREEKISNRHDSEFVRYTMISALGGVMALSFNPILDHRYSFEQVKNYAVRLISSSLA